MVSRRCAKSIGPTGTFGLREVELSALEAGRCDCLKGEVPLSTARILDAAVVAVATDCRGRELRKGGDSFGAVTETYALSRLLGWVVERLDGGGLRLEPDVLLENLGAELAVEVFVRGEASEPCCLDVLPLDVERLPKAEGELDRVDAGLPWLEASFILLVSIGRREVGEVGEVGEIGEIGEVGDTGDSVSGLPAPKSGRDNTNLDPARSL